MAVVTPHIKGMPKLDINSFRVIHPDALKLTIVAP